MKFKFGMWVADASSRSPYKNLVIKGAQLGVGHGPIFMDRVRRISPYYDLLFSVSFHVIMF